MTRCLLADEQFEQVDKYMRLTEDDEEEEEDKDREIKHYRINYILHLDEKSVFMFI